jgi:hypothetical protein
MSMASRAKAFIRELVSLTRPHKKVPLARGAKLGREVFGCYVGVFAMGEDTVYLDQIACKPGEEGKGAGSYALMMVCLLADRFGVKIVGYATYNLQLTGEDDERLRRWYERHGFEFPPNEWKHAGLSANMFREPTLWTAKNKLPNKFRRGVSLKSAAKCVPTR